MPMPSCLHPIRSRSWDVATSSILCSLCRTLFTEDPGKPTVSVYHLPAQGWCFNVSAPNAPSVLLDACTGYRGARSAFRAALSKARDWALITS